MSANTSEVFSRQVEATINYVARIDEPIYTYDFIEPPPGKPATNRVLEPHQVSIHNMRELKSPPTLDAEGFMIAPFITKVRDIYDTAEIDTVYNPEIARLLKELLGAREVRVFMPFLRGPEAQRRAPGSITAPAGSAHVDYTAETGPNFSKKFLARMRKSIGVPTMHLSMCGDRSPARSEITRLPFAMRARRLRRILLSQRVLPASVQTGCTPTTASYANTSRMRPPGIPNTNGITSPT